jgi:predicted SAM-dependent methyltransferase
MMENLKSFYRFGKAVLPAPLKGVLMDAMRFVVSKDIESTINNWRHLKAQPEAIQKAAQNLLEEIRIDRVVNESIKDFAALKGRKNLKLHLGAGSDIRIGWVNIDLALRIPPQIDPVGHPDTVFINHDLRRGLPLDEASCDYIYSSHFFEHLEYTHGLQLMRECFHVLRPEGVFRISLPNLKELFGAYLREDHEYVNLIEVLGVLPEVEPGTEMLVDYVNYGVYQFGEHKRIYDEEKVMLLLKRIGYRSVTVSCYQEGIDPSEIIRRKYSFYVEAVK